MSHRDHWSKISEKAGKSGTSAASFNSGLFLMSVYIARVRIVTHPGMRLGDSKALGVISRRTRRLKEF